MLTRNELLDRLISALQDESHRLYLDWIHEETDLSFHESNEYIPWLSILKQIIELEEQYD